MSKLTRDDLLEYEHLQSELKRVKKKEIDLRNKIIKNFRYSKLEGMVHKSIPDIPDIDIGITLKLTRSLDADALDTLWSELTPDQRECIVYKPSLDLKLYKELLKSGEEGELMNIVTEKPAQASVELKFEP